MSAVRFKLAVIMAVGNQSVCHYCGGLVTYWQILALGTGSDRRRGVKLLVILRKRLRRLYA